MPRKPKKKGIIVDIDYKKLLKRYIRYVGNLEGTDFVLSCDRQYASDVTFSREEWAELNKICEQIDAENA